MRPIRMACSPVLVLAMMVVWVPACSRDDSPPASPSTPKPAATAKDPTASQESDADATDSTDEAPVDAVVRMATIELADGRTSIPLRRERRSRLSLVTGDILTKWVAWQRMSIKSSFTYVRTQPGSRRRQNGHGTIDYMKRDGVVLIRNKSANTMGIERMPNDFVQTGERKLEIFDGTFVYTLQDVHAGTFAFKRRQLPGEVNVIGGPRLLAAINATGDLTLAPDELVDGFPTYVFKTRQDGGKVETDYFIDQDTGLMRKMEVRDHQADSVLTFTYGDFEIDPSFPDDHFTFKLPEGVKLKDSTQSADNTKSPSP